MTIILAQLLSLQFVLAYTLVFFCGSCGGLAVGWWLWERTSLERLKQSNEWVARGNKIFGETNVMAETASGQLRYAKAVLVDCQKLRVAGSKMRDAILAIPGNIPLGPPGVAAYRYAYEWEDVEAAFREHIKTIPFPEMKTPDVPSPRETEP